MEASMVDEFVIDNDYEFDAAQYFDFSQPETFEETAEAERWFESALSYPPSPFSPKSNWRYDIPEDIGADNSDSRRVRSVAINADGSSRGKLRGQDAYTSDVLKQTCEENDLKGGLDFCNQMDQDISKSKIKSVSRTSTFMKPTASYLAKQIQTQEVSCEQFLRRFQKLYGKMDKSICSYLIEKLATKRQKLEAGCFCKVSHLKHQAFFLHKVPNEAGHLAVISVSARSKVTIPREPNLEIANRVQRHWSKINAESAEHAKSNTCTSKARPLNRKVFKSPALPLTKKCTLPPTGCQEFQLRTSERARQHAHNNVANMHNYNSVSQNETKDSKRLNSVYAQMEEKCEVTQKVKSHPCNKKLKKGELGVLGNIKQETVFPVDFDFPADKTFFNQPPIEGCQRASVHANIKPKSKLRSPSKMMKAVKKDSPALVQKNQNHFPRSGGSEPTGRRIAKVGRQHNISRNLNIR